MKSTKQKTDDSGCNVDLLVVGTKPGLLVDKREFIMIHFSHLDLMSMDGLKKQGNCFHTHFCLSSKT